MTTLSERASLMASGPANGTTHYPEQMPAAQAEPQLPDIDLDDTFVKESAQLTVFEAWLLVRRDVRAIDKGQTYQANGTRYQFRGVDEVVNKFSPATLRHGVNIIPFRTEAVYKETNTSGGKRQCDCTVTVTWHIYGPKGDRFEAQTCGQALDLQDKAAAKAQSVAWRTLLLEAGTTPTRDPDPEFGGHDRGEARTREPQSYFAEIRRKSTSRDRLAQIRSEIIGLRLAREPIENEEDEHEELLAALDRIGKERFAPKPAAGPACERCEKPGHHADACPTLDGGAQ